MGESEVERIDESGNIWDLAMYLHTSHHHHPSLHLPPSVSAFLKHTECGKTTWNAKTSWNYQESRVILFNIEASNCFLCYKLGSCDGLISLPGPVSCNAECSLREWLSPDLWIRCKIYISKKEILNSILCYPYHHIKFQVSLTLPSRTYLTLCIYKLNHSIWMYISELCGGCYKRSKAIYSELKPSKSLVSLTLMCMND